MKGTSIIRMVYSMNQHAARNFTIALICSAFGALMQPIPLIATWKMFVQSQSTQSSLQFIIPVALAFVAIIAYSVLTVSASACAHKAAFGMSTAITTAMVEHVGRIPLHWLNSISNGELKKMMSHDVDQIENFIAHNMTDFVAALTLPLVTIPVLFFINRPLALIMLVTVIIAEAIQIHSISLLQKNDLMAEYSRTMAELHGDAVEYVQGMPDIKIFNRAGESLSRMQKAINRFKDIQTRSRKLTLHSWALFSTILSLPFAIIAITGVYLHRYHETPLEDVILFIILGVVTFIPFKRLMRFVTFLWRASQGYSSVKKLLEVEVEEIGNRHHSELASTDVQVQELNVYYGNKQVLHDINFIAKAGTVTAIVGPSGSGKSTLAATIAGLEQARNGSISVGGIPLHNFAPGELARVISVVYQSPFIFSGTIRDNICLGTEAPKDEAIHRAAAMVQCDEFIKSFPNGYETRIGAGGIPLSGGQKQRIALARMALQNAPVVLLDEATAFADAQSEAAIQKGLSGFLADKTVLVIAHRLSSIAKADRILVLSEGRIVESGTHEELLESQIIYPRMWQAYHAARSWMLTTDAEVQPASISNHGGPKC